MSAPAPYIGTHPAGKPLNGFFQAALKSRTVIAAAAATVLALAGLSAAAINSDYLHDGATAKYWPRDAIDDYAFASIQAKRAAELTGGRKSLLLVGTAAMREGLLPAKDIERLVSDRMGRAVPVINLSTGGQSPLEAAGLVWEVAPKASGTLVLAVSPSRMAASGGELQNVLDHPRLAFTNEGIRREAEALGLKVPASSGSYLLDNLQFYSIRLPSFAANLARGRAAENDVQTYISRGKEDGDSWGKDIKTLSKRLSGYDKNFGNNIAPYQRLIRWVKDNHLPWNVVLLEIPLNPRALAEATGPDFYKKHVATMEAFCRQEGCRYVNSNVRNLLGEEHFYDWSHLSSQRGKEIFTDAFLNDIQEIL